MSEIVVYPRLLRRVQAALFDSVIIAVIWYGSVLVVASTQPENAAVRILILFGPVASLEPVLVATIGSTVGHYWLGLRVRRATSDRNLNLFVAYWRFFIKVFVGWLSLIFILVTRKHQAIHDLAAGAIVVYRHDRTPTGPEAVQERVVEVSGFTYPSPLRRVTVIVAYLVGASLGIVVISGFYQFMAGCLEVDVCKAPGARLVENLLAIVWLLIVAGVIVLGWSGRLYGCRRRKIE